MNRLDPLLVPLKGLRLIEASAGTGKTHAIVTLYLRLVLGPNAQTPRRVREILVVTFTRAATEELRGRVRQRLFEALDVLQRVQAGDRRWLDADAEAGKSIDSDLRALLVDVDAEQRVNEAATRLRLELSAIDDAAIFTIHGFCQRALQEQAFDSGEPFDLELVPNDSRREVQAVQDHWRARYYGDAVLASVARRCFGTPEGLGRQLQPLLRPGLRLRVARVSPSEILARKAELAAAWQSGGSTLVKAIHGFDKLSRGPYKTDSVERAASRMDEWCTAESVLLPDEALLFARVRLDSSLTSVGQRNGEYFPDHALVALVSAYLDACTGLQRTLVADAAEEVRGSLERVRDESGVAAFEDLVARLHAALTGPSGRRLAGALATRYPIALIDEFQDTDPRQYEIFRAIYSEAQRGEGLVLIGDPKQAIYSFRGADVFAYGTAREAAGPDRAYSLDRNWRSVEPLVKAVNTLFNRSNPFVLRDVIEFTQVVAAGRADAKRLQVQGSHPIPLEFWLLPDGDKGRPLSKDKAAAEILPQVARRIAELLARGQRAGQPLAPRDIAVLVRTNRQAEEVQKALRRVGIGSAMAGAASVFATDEAPAMRDVLAAILSPASDRALRRALVSPLWPHDAAFLAALGDDLAGYDDLLQALGDWRATWQGRGFMPMFRQFMNTAGVAATLLSLPDGERRLTNLVQIAELLQQASRDHPSPETLLRWLEDGIARPDGNADEQQLRLESDEDLLHVLTLHRAKGLQYPVVFLPFLYETRPVDPGKEFPRYHDEERRLVVDLEASREGVKQAERERLAEDLRLLYVGLTRAQDYCIVPWGRINMTERSALAYLLHGPDAMVEVDELAETMEGLNHADIARQLHDLAKGHNDQFRVVDIANAAPEHVSPPTVQDSATGGLAARKTTRAVARAYETTSFSRLASDHYDDVREVAAQREPERGETPVPPGEVHTPFTLPGGTSTGHLFHEVLEEIDYAPPLAEPLRQVVARRLERRGKPASWCDVVTVIIENTLDVELEEGLTLRSLSRDRRRNELQFWYPISRIRPEALEALLPGLGAGVETPRLRFRPVQGYLEGFIDLVFEHRGRWYVVDWKTNKLGPDISWYSREHLARAIADARYDLQYSLYTVALHRHLQRALGARYDPALHLGGVYYLFLRGIQPGNPARPGIWHVPAEVAYVQELDALFRGREEAR